MRTRNLKNITRIKSWMNEQSDETLRSEILLENVNTEEVFRPVVNAPRDHNNNLTED